VSAVVMGKETMVLTVGYERKESCVSTCFVKKQVRTMLSAVSGGRRWVFAVHRARDGEGAVARSA
jgi:hypothetical protein